MKKNVTLMLGLASVLLLAGCGGQKVENTDIEDQATDVVVADETTNEDIAQAHPERVKTSLTLEDLERIEETMPPQSYDYQTYDMSTETIVNSGKYEVAEGETAVFSIPEYENMVSREVTNSGIEDDMIYTTVKMTLQDGSVLNVLYVNEPDTLFCRAISIENGDQNTLYSNFIYLADMN